MYRINYIYRIKGKEIDILTPAELSLAEIKAQMELQTSYYISVKDDQITYIAPYQGLNLNLLLLETIFNACSTWAEVETQLTDYWVTSYRTKIPGYVAGTKMLSQALLGYYVFSEINENRSEASSADNSGTSAPRFEVSYLDSREWGARNLAFMKGRMPDLLIGCPTDIDPANCLVVCNGHILRSVALPADAYSETHQLLIRNGATYLRETNQNFQPDLLLLDFSALGNVQTMSLSSCRVQTRERQNLTLEVPGVQLKGVTPLLVLGGCLYFPHELQTSGQTIRFNLASCNLSDALLHRAHCQQEFWSGTTVFSGQVGSSLEYLTKDIWEEDCEDAFLILVSNSDILVHHEAKHLFATQQLTVDHSATSGLLRHRTTGLILGYVYSAYQTEHLLYTGHKQQLWRLSELDTQLPLGSTAWGCRHSNRDYMDPFQGSDDDAVTTQHSTTLDMFQLIR